MRMLFQAKAVSWDLIKAENPRYLHEVSNHILLYFITITPVRVIVEILYHSKTKRYGSLRVQRVNGNIISFEDCHSFLFFCLMESVLEQKYFYYFSWTIH